MNLHYLWPWLVRSPLYRQVSCPPSGKTRHRYLVVWSTWHRRNREGDKLILGPCVPSAKAPHPIRSQRILSRNACHTNSTQHLHITFPHNLLWFAIRPIQIEFLISGQFQFYDGIRFFEPPTNIFS